MRAAQAAIDEFNGLERFPEGVGDEEKVRARELAERMGAVLAYFRNCSTRELAGLLPSRVLVETARSKAAQATSAGRYCLYSTNAAGSTPRFCAWTIGCIRSRRMASPARLPMALDLLRHGAYCKRKRRWVRADHGRAGRREHVRGRGAAIVGTGRPARRFAAQHSLPRTVRSSAPDRIRPDSVRSHSEPPRGRVTQHRHVEGWRRAPA